jgi:hypothetical protein
MGILFGKLSKKQMISDALFRKNLPTEKTFLVNSNKNFEEEKNKLIGLVQSSAQQGTAGLTKEPHPFFGKLTESE